MTLDEAIEHLDEKINSNDWPCEECKQEHIQLKAWLSELRDRRQNDAKKAEERDRVKHSLGGATA